MGLDYVMSGATKTTNQIAVCKGESCVWRFHPDFRMAIFIVLKTETDILVLILALL